MLKFHEQTLDTTTRGFNRGSFPWELDMDVIKMFHAPWMGLKALTIVVVGKQHHKALDISWGREALYSSPKKSFLGSSTIDVPSNLNI